IRHTAIGKALLFLTGLLVIGALTLFLFVEPIEIAAWLANPDVILGMVVVNLVLLTVRLFSTEHAWWAGGGHRWFVALALAVIVAIPHVAIGWAGMETRGTLQRVFPEAPAAVAAPLPTTTTSTSSTTTTTAPLELSPIRIAPGQYEEDRIEASTTAGWAPFGEDRLNILLLGGDAGPGRGGLRTDTMIVASVDPVSGDSALVGVPRNYGGVRFTDDSPIPVQRLNHVYGWGTSHPDAFGGVDPGASAVVDAIQHITGLDIDHFVLVDLTGFSDMIDVFGGVRLVVPEPVDGPLYDPVSGGYEMVEIPAGNHHLDGDHALAYARARYGSSDYARMARQRCILTSLAGQADPLEIFTRLPDVLSVVEENVSTDIPAGTLPDLVRLLLSIDASEIRVIGFDSSWSVGRTSDGHAIPDVERIRDAVRVTLDDPASAADLGAAAASESCG
ncbi:MAG: LCP family protein, partial [Acidimicrobiia bacterium]